MIRLFARTTAFLVLTLTLAFTGYVAASARGQTRAAGSVLVLCSGAGLVQVTLDENGVPTGRTHLCPDLAVSLISALEVTVPVVVRPESPAHRAEFAVAPIALAAVLPSPTARDPPDLA